MLNKRGCKDVICDYHENGEMVNDIIFLSNDE